MKSETYDIDFDSIKEIANPLSNFDLMTCFRILMNYSKDLYKIICPLQASNATTSYSVPTINLEEIHNEYDGIFVIFAQSYIF